MCQLVGEISRASQQHSHLLIFPRKYRRLPHLCVLSATIFSRLPVSVWDSGCINERKIQEKGFKKRKKKSSELDAQTTREIINSKILKEHCSCIRCLPIYFCLLSSGLKKSPINPSLGGAWLGALPPFAEFLWHP